MTLYYNALFYSLRDNEETFAAILVDEEGIIRETYQVAPADFQGKKIDLQGTFVFPGFVDTHSHSYEGGLYSLTADLGNSSDLPEIFQKLKDTQPIDEMIIGYNLDENLLAEKRFPTKEELDKLFPHTPCLIRRIDGHSVQVNSKTKKLIEQWGKISLPEESIFRGNWNDYVCHWFHKSLSEERVLEAYQRAAELAIRAGHTTIHTMIGDAKNDPLHYQFLHENKKELPIDYILYPQIFNVRSALDLGAERIGGCILADGSFGSGTAALTRPYVNNPDNYGILYKTDHAWEEFILEAHNNGLQVAVHCIGDASIKQILRAYVKAQRQNRRDVFHQIIHAELITDQEVIDLMSEHRIAAVMQPVFDLLWGGEDKFYAKVIGKDRALSCNRFHSLVSAGVLVTGGSDWYVTEMNALKGIYAAVNHHNTAERLTTFEALSLYTTNAAQLIKAEDRVGKLISPMEADFVCLDRDLLHDEDILSIKVNRVVKRGRIIL